MLALLVQITTSSQSDEKFCALTLPIPFFSTCLPHILPVPAEGTDCMETADRISPYLCMSHSLEKTRKGPSIHIALSQIWAQLALARQTDKAFIKCFFCPRGIPLHHHDLRKIHYIRFTCTADWWAWSISFQILIQIETGRYTTSFIMAHEIGHKLNIFAGWSLKKTFQLVSSCWVCLE